jgi:purine nucleosidase
VAQKFHAVDAMLAATQTYPGLTLVTLGPLTNIALALARDPSFPTRVERCVVMGGAPCCEGNVTPAAEYNIWVDPEAARMVFRSALPLEMIGWQLSRGASVLDDTDIARALALDTVKAHFAIDRAVGTTWSRHAVEIETQSALTRGMTVVDRLNVTHDANNAAAWEHAVAAQTSADICWDIDAARFKAMLLDALR